MNAIEYWRELQREAAARELRLDTEREVARWRRLADRYDRNALHTSAPDFVAGVAALVQPGESVLEIGPGTGGFTLPVALRAGSVLGVDLSDAMRAALERKLAEAGNSNVRLIGGEWPDVEVQPHDVVLAVNSLYRVAEIGACIEAMTRVARRRVLVGWSVGHNPPVLPSLVDPAGTRGYRPGVTYIHLLLALHEMGIAADVAIHRVRRWVRRGSMEEATTGLLGVPDPTEVERREAEVLARRTFRPDGAGVIHEYEGQAVLIGWDGAAKG